MIRVVYVIHAVLVSINIKYVTNAAEWNYNDDAPYGPANWSLLYPTCGGSSQSPIDIVTSRATELTNVTQLDFQHYNEQVYNAKLANNGHSAEVLMPDPRKYSISGGGLNGTYYLVQFHFHWGNSSNNGSEHRIDSASYPLEIHLVHYNGAFDQLLNATASGRPDALAVLAVFVNDATADPNTALGNLTNSLGNISLYHNETEIEPFRLVDLLPSQRQFYRYQGSLTTPTCNEIVTWTVFKQPISITPDQMKQFRTNIHTENGEVLTHNYRPPQPINNRTVYTSCDNNCNNTATTEVATTATTSGSVPVSCDGLVDAGFMTATIILAILLGVSLIANGGAVIYAYRQHHDRH